MQKKNRLNQHTVDFFKSLINQCHVKRARVAFKHMSKAADCSLYVTLPGLIDLHAPSRDTLNVLLVNASDKEIIDHGRWVALLGYLRNNKNLNINLWIIPKQAVKGVITKARNAIDFLIEKDYEGQVNTNLVTGNFETIVNEIGIDNIDLIINDNPEIDDHNSPKSMIALRTIISKGIPYVISDMSPLVLLFKLNFFNCWGVTSSQNQSFNKYSQSVQTNISAPLRHMGYSFVLDTLIESPSHIEKEDRQIFNAFAESLVSCLNIGEPMQRLPSVESLVSDAEVKLLDQFYWNKKDNKLVCTHSGDKISIQFDTLPSCPVLTIKELTTTEQSELVMWMMSLYRCYLQAYSKKIKEPVIL